MGRPVDTRQAAQQRLGHFFAVFLVKTPLSPGRLAAVHQHVQTAALALVELRHEPAFSTGRPIQIVGPRIQKAGGWLDIERDVGIASRCPKTSFCNEVYWISHDHSADTTITQVLKKPQTCTRLPLKAPDRSIKALGDQAIAIARH